MNSCRQTILDSRPPLLPAVVAMLGRGLVMAPLLVGMATGLVLAPLEPHNKTNNTRIGLLAHGHSNQDGMGPLVVALVGGVGPIRTGARTT